MSYNSAEKQQYDIGSNEFRDSSSSVGYKNLNIPRITVQVFAESQEFYSAAQNAAADRRISRANVKLIAGGINAAVEAYKNQSTPNVLIVESLADEAGIRKQLEALAEVCDPGTKVVLVGLVNDVSFYRELINEGISEYCLLPLQPFQILETIAGLYKDNTAKALGQSIVFIGSSGGVGSSTLCHNIAWNYSKEMNQETVLVDMDIAFGTASLNFYQEPAYGIAEVMNAKEQVDENFIDRVLHKCSDNFNLLSAPANLEHLIDISSGSYSNVIDILRGSTPNVFIDLPHGWNPWIKQALYTADHIVITSSNDLTGLRNTKNFVDLITQIRQNDKPPLLVLNQVDIPKRPEIKPSEFSNAIGLDYVAAIDFDPYLFGTASNNGQMIKEVDPDSNTAQIINDLCYMLSGDRPAKSHKKQGGLSGLIKNLVK